MWSSQNSLWLMVRYSEFIKYSSCISLVFNLLRNFSSILIIYNYDNDDDAYDDDDDDNNNFDSQR